MSSFSSQQVTLGAMKDAPLLTIERVVAILTPLFTAAGGALSTGIGAAVGIPAKDFTDLFIAGATPALGAALTWLFGRQKFLKAEADVQEMVEKAYHAVMSDQPAAATIRDIEHRLEVSQDTIIHEIAAKIGAPASAEEIAREMLDQAEHRQQAAARAAAALSGTLAGGGAPGGSSPAAGSGPAAAGAVAAS